MLKRTILATILVFATLSAQTVTKVGMTTCPFLKIGVGGRAAGMGEAFVATANDASALYWNPAGIAQLSRPEFLFVKSNWIADIYHTFVGFVMPLGVRGVVGGSITYLGMPEMEVRTVYQPNGTGERWHYSELAAAVSYGKYFTDKFAFGGTAKLLYDQLYNMSATGVAVDVGLIYHMEFRNLTIGMSLTNFGTKMRLVGENTRFIYHLEPERDPNSQPNVPADLRTESWELPMRFQVGLSGYAVQTKTVKLLVEVDAVHPNDNTPYGNIGAELQVGNFLALRAGHRWIGMRDREGGLSAGFGINWRMPGNGFAISIDYGYTDIGRLKDVHRMSVIFKF